MGDWGGLLDALNFLATIIMLPYSSYALNQHLVSLGVVKLVPSGKPKRQTNTV